MKTIFTLLASLVLSISLFAAEAKPKSALSIKAVDNADIRVVLDGRNFEPNDNALMVQGLDEGYHTIKVYKQRRNGVFSIAGKKFELAYSNTISLKRRTHLFITIERNGLISMQENKLKRTDGRDNNNGYEYNQGETWGDYDTHEGYASGMSNNEFSRVLQSIDREWLEGNKIKSATQVVKTNRLTSAQVKQLVQLFSFENNKLELAKQAYATTVDKRNYDMIFDLFSFSSSKLELERFIRNSR